MQMMAEGGSTAEKDHENEGSVEVKDDVSNNINIPFGAAPDDQDDVKILKPIS